MVKLNKIYTKTGDDGTTGLSDGSRVKKYDLIILNHVIEHFIDPIEKLLQIKALLNQGGLLYLGLPNIQSYGIGQIQNAHYWYFSPLNFAKLLNHYGSS